MRDGSAKLILAAAGLVGVWIVTYWLWPEKDHAPAITFDETTELFEEAPVEDEVLPVEAAPTSEPEPKLSTSTNTIGSTLPPAPTPEFPVVTPPEFDEHIVAENETIWSIAEARWNNANLGSVIARANPTVDPKALRAGMRLLIPKDPRNIQGTPVGAKPPAPKPEITEYTVEQGDTLGGISMQFYGTTRLWTRIRDANPSVVGADGDVRVGAKLLIPPPPPGDEGT